MKLSVIVPIYNAEKYLDRCIQSILRQNMDDIEIICVDDGSSDCSYDILKNYEQQYKNIIVIRQENQYAGVARNRGIEVARGEYIHFLDVDDYIFDNVYLTIYEQAKKYGVDILKFRNYCFLAENGEQREADRPDYTMVRIPDDYFNGCMLDLEKDIRYFVKDMTHTPWSGLYRRDFLLENNIKFNNLICVNDRSFFVETIIKAKRIALSDKVVVNHQVGNSNSLVGIRAKNFGCHYSSYNMVEKITDSVDIQIQRLILNEELRDILVWYRISPIEVAIKERELFFSFLDNINWTKIERDEIIESELKKARRSGFKCEDLANKIFFAYSKVVSSGYRIGDLLKEQCIESIYIYGTGEIGRMVLSDLKISDEEMVKGIFDKMGETESGMVVDTFSDIKVKSPLEIPFDDVPILITPSKDYIEIEAQLLSQGIEKTRLMRLYDVLDSKNKSLKSSN